MEVFRAINRAFGHLPGPRAGAIIVTCNGVNFEVSVFRLLFFLTSRSLTVFFRVSAAALPAAAADQLQGSTDSHSSPSSSRALAQWSTESKKTLESHNLAGNYELLLRKVYYELEESKRHAFHHVFLILVERPRWPRTSHIVVSRELR